MTSPFLPRGWTDRVHPLTAYVCRQPQQQTHPSPWGSAEDNPLVWRHTKASKRYWHKGVGCCTLQPEGEESIGKTTATLDGVILYTNASGVSSELLKAPTGTRYLEVFADKSLRILRVGSGVLILTRSDPYWPYQEAVPYMFLLPVGPWSPRCTFR
jgi:hypothetical protein